MSLKWHIEKRDVSTLKGWEDNPRTIGEKEFNDLKDSINQDGDWGVLVIDTDGTVISGNQRLRANDGQVDVKVPSRPLTEKEKRRIALRANRTKGKDDFDVLANWNKEDLLDGWLDEASIDRLVSVQEDTFDAQAEYDKIVQPRAVLGDLWALGEHRLLCGDSTKEESYQKLLGKEVADLIYTDPPYNVNYGYTVRYVGNRVRKKRKMHEVFKDKWPPQEFIKFLSSVFKNCYLFSNESTCFYCWHASKTEHLFRQALNEADWYVSQTLHWLKDNCTFSMGMDYLYINERCNVSKKRSD